jgi:hypothetical protein
MIAPLERCLRLTDAELARADLAMWNLLIGDDLPSLEKCPLDQALKILDDWVHLVERGTSIALAHPAYASERSAMPESQFRMLILATVLQRNIGVRYDLSLVDQPYDARDPLPLFLHGLLFERKGTCATLPVLYAAIGRRLGYPLRLVPAKSHLFCRWDDESGEPFNIESTSSGFNMRPDSHYREWPAPFTTAEFAKRRYLCNLTSRQELACFFEQRGVFWLDHLRFADAAEAFGVAERLNPADDYYRMQRRTAEALGMLTTDIKQLCDSNSPLYAEGVRLPEFLTNRLDDDNELIVHAEYDLNRILANRRRERGLPALIFR